MKRIATLIIPAIALTALLSLTMQPAQPQFLPDVRPELVVFTADWCEPCKKFQADARKGVIQFQTTVTVDVRQFRRQPDGTHYRVVKADAKQWSDPRTVEAAQRATGRRVDSVPTFWISGANFTAEGYLRK